SVAVEGAVRRNGEGSWLKFEYSQALGQHWRATSGFTWIRGSQTDFLGQYHQRHRGSKATLVLTMNRRTFLKTSTGTLLGSAGAIAPLAGQSKRPPNVILIYADDLGYGDLG